MQKTHLCYRRCVRAAGRHAEEAHLPWELPRRNFLPWVLIKHLKEILDNAFRIMGHRGLCSNTVFCR